MVCGRCIMAVRDILERVGLNPVEVVLGEAILKNELIDTDRQLLQERLREVGFELIDDRRTRIIEQVKNAVVELVHRDNAMLKVNLSDYVSDKIHQDYGSISHLFSEVENTTIEKYFIAQKIERVKELLVYDELTLNEIADLMNYSSAAHLSAQFKKITGLTPSHYKRIKENRRIPLDKI